MSISFKGYGENVLTFNTDNIYQAGIPVSILDDCRVMVATADKDFVGITCYADGVCAGVIMDGYVEMPYTGSAPSYGFCNLVANGSGGVKVASGTTSNHTVRVLKIDPNNNIVGFIL